MSEDSNWLCSTGKDKAIKFFNIVGFDLVTMIDCDFTPTSSCWITPAGSFKHLVAVGCEESGAIRVFDMYVYDLSSVLFYTQTYFLSL